MGMAPPSSYDGGLDPQFHGTVWEMLGAMALMGELWHGRGGKGAGL